MPDLRNKPPSETAPGSAPQKARAGSGDPPGGAAVSTPRHRPAANQASAEGGGSPSGEDSYSTAQRIAEAKAQSAEDDAISRRLRRLKDQGLLLDRVAAIDCHLNFVGQVGVTLDRMAADCATDLANELGCTEHQAFIALRKIGDRVRSDLAIYAEKERERLGIDEEIPDPAPEERGGLRPG